jgi:ATP/maltotriose-dependent transcriptional regulator MalT
MIVTSTDEGRTIDPLDALRLGREAFERHAWQGAYDRLATADRGGELAGADLAMLAVAAFLTGRDHDALDILTRAHHAYLRENETLPAVRCAFWLGFFFRYQGDAAQSNGWLARGRRLLEGMPETPEHGYLMLLDGLGHHWGGDPETAYGMFEECLSIGVRLDVADLTVLGRMSIGDSLIERGEVARGTALFDEVMAATTAGEVSPILVGIVYCAVIGACHRSFDIRRAHEWTAAFNQWCESEPELVPYRGECLVFRCEIMQMQGAWPLAMEEIMRATDGFSEDRFLPWAGDAFYQQAELYRLCGDYAHAEAAYRRASQQGNSLRPGIALMRLAQGRADVAAATIRRLFAEAGNDLDRARLLPAHIEIMIAAGDLDAAETSTRELTALALQRNVRYLQALAGQATGALLLARGKAAESLPPLRGAIECWFDMNAPFEAARVRTMIGLACRALGDEDTASLELDAAAETFRRLGALPDLERLQLLRSAPGAAGSGGLTERELEVLRLVAAGNSNRAIAEQLVVSEHTVRRHLQNIFAKLGVSSRSAATAYAYQHSLI